MKHVKEGVDYLKSVEGHTISMFGHRVFRNTPNHTPLAYLEGKNPKTHIFPKGFKRMLAENYPLASFELKTGKKVYGFRTQDIIEQNFNQRTKW
jgi:hypothetical protein